MTRISMIAVAALLLGSAGAAQGGMVMSSSAFAGFDAAAQSLVIDFDHPLPAGITLTGGLLRTTDDGLGAQPAVASGVKGSSTYWSVNAGDPGTLLSTTGYNTISFLWGSMDAYNTLSLLNADGSVMAHWTGGQVYQPSNGDQFGAATNRRVTFTSDADLIYGLRLESTQPAFEIDDVAFANAVPEPATWAMMIVGFGAIGTTLRTRRTRHAAA